MIVKTGLFRLYMRPLLTFVWTQGGEGAVPVRGPTRCTKLHVLPALPPDFVAPSPADGTSFVFYMGRETSIPFSVLPSSNHQRIEWQFVHLPTGVDVSPEAFSECSLEGRSVATADVGGGGRGGGDGINGGGGGGGMSQGGDGGSGRAEGEQSEGAACWGRRRNLTWVPAWNQGGLKRNVCVSLWAPATGCEPTPGLPQPIRCYTLQVARCVYAVQDDQKLDEIAAVYSTTWLDMFALNPTIKMPDRVMSMGQLINVGHLYRVVPGDYLQKISNRFGSTVEGILAMNADILPEHADDIKANQEICVQPAACIDDTIPRN
jgi:hypothetical protein